MLVADGSYRGWRDVITHDHTAYERQLESTVVTLAGLFAQATIVTPSSSIVAVLLSLVAGLQTRVETGPIVVDLLGDSLEIEGRRVRVSQAEWDVMVYLSRRLGTVVSYDELVDWIWPNAAARAGRPPSHQVGRSALRGAVQRLRGALGAHADLIEVRPTLGVMLRYEPPREVS